MTAIVGALGDGVAYIGGDSAVISGSDGESSSTTETKVFTVGPCAIGMCGSARAGNLVRTHLTLPKYKAKMDVMAYVVTHVAGGIRTLLEAHGCVDSKGSSDGWDSQALVGLAGRLFWIGSDFGVIEPVDGIAAVGSGGPYALGALRALVPRERPVQTRTPRGPIILPGWWQVHEVWSPAVTTFELQPDNPTVERCHRALQVAAQCSAYVSGPYWMVSSQSDGTVNQPWKLT